MWQPQAITEFITQCPAPHIRLRSFLLLFRAVLAALAQAARIFSLQILEVSWGQAVPCWSTAVSEQGCVIALSLFLS